MANFDLRRFCEAHDRRSLGRPFSQGGYTFASNGRIVVRVARVDDVPERASAPDAEAFFAAAPAVTCLPITPPELPRIENDECESCSGRGTQHACPNCVCRCRECNGTGEAEGDGLASVALSGAVFSLKYVRQMFSLPGLRVPAKTAPREAMPFVFDGGDGLIMPRIRPAGRHFEFDGLTLVERRA